MNTEHRDPMDVAHEAAEQKLCDDLMNRDAEIRDAMAKLDGWERVALWYQKDSQCRGGNPDYLKDLNAVHDVEAHLLKNQPHLRLTYRRLLIEVCADSPDKFEHYWRASAEQRCEAILKTTGKWNTKWEIL